MRAKERKMLTDMIADVLERHVADFWRVMDTVSTLLRHAELDTQSYK